MRGATILVCLVVGLLVSVSSAGVPPWASEIHMALSADPAEAATGIQFLRAGGPEALAALLASEPGDPARFAAAVDAVAQQRDATASKLYWYTDLEQAKAAAKASGKPILSLRLLGKLTDEFSCANSRFFRTVLYANTEVSDVLRRDFILHWSSERPVPKVTIDFGDGRKIERTVTGNSIHYVLDAQGRPVDALPGLYGPKAFLRGLAEARPFAIRCGNLAEKDRQQLLSGYHEIEARQLQAAWTQDAARAGVPIPVGAAKNEGAVAQRGNPPAVAAGMIAQPKFKVERPILRALNPEEMVQFESSLDNKTWNRIAALHAADAALDLASQEMIRKQNPEAYGREACTTRMAVAANKPLANVIQQFESLIALDTVRNEYMLHRQISEWFLNDPATTAAFDKLNARVYAELFLTPASDPWLGLAPADTYTALESDGLVKGK